MTACGVVLALGAHADAVEARLERMPAEIIRCDDWQQGISASLRSGFAAAVRSGCDWVVVMLADEPMLPAAEGARDLIERVVSLEVACDDLGDARDVDIPEQLEELRS